ncbi:DsbA family oxidoreductase [Dermacoccus nishinomiyaensis]|uniref:DsbA family oxidoreductase n=1 Tax=Dermacoccus nishinomiyaensis TaxID=1274 RepID=UPI0009405CC0|nr:DsbA family protein [Dermacoccus nishinomiyaensis]
MERIEFFYDPCCPFCWITSRFLLEVSVERDVDVTWRPFSLAMKNNELAGDDDAVDEHGEMHRSSHRVLRVITKAAEQHGASVIDLYSAFGRRFHLDHEKYDDAMIADVLAAAGLPAELAKAADDTSLDGGLQASIDSAVEAVGDDTGVPTIVFVSDDGQRRGFYGPVLQELPSKDDALRLWDSLVGLVSVPAFYELKRTRPEGMPNTASTKGL